MAGRILDDDQAARHIVVMVKKIGNPAIDVITRALVRRCRSAVLATALGGKRKGWPYASLVTVACRTDGSPILLMSTLADHTRNLLEDPRASLLFEEASYLPNPQTGPRVTLTGTLHPTDDAALASRFLSRHPGAKLYAGFADFRFYVMKVDRAHYVGGFGRAKWLGAKKFLFEAKASEALAVGETKALKRLNEKYAQSLLRLMDNAGKKSNKLWTAYGLDPEGIDLVRNNIFGRIEFDRPVQTTRGVAVRIKQMS
jgi:heme iron utilization protein